MTESHVATMTFNRIRNPSHVQAACFQAGILRVDVELRQDDRSAGRTKVPVHELAGIAGTTAAVAACSHQNSYAPPEPMQCAQRMICAGDAGRLNHSGETCRCARLDYNKA